MQLACNAPSVPNAAVNIAGAAKSAYPGYPLEMYTLTARYVCSNDAPQVSEATELVSRLATGDVELCTTSMQELIASGDRDLAALQQFCFVSQRTRRGGSPETAEASMLLVGSTVRHSGSLLLSTGRFESAVELGLPGRGCRA